MNALSMLYGLYSYDFSHLVIFYLPRPHLPGATDNLNIAPPMASSRLEKCAVQRIARTNATSRRSVQDIQRIARLITSNQLNIVSSAELPTTYAATTLKILKLVTMDRIKSSNWILKERLVVDSFPR